MKTKTIKKLLIALDYDKTAIKVADAGYSLAKAMNAEVTLMHVISDPVYYASTEYSPIMGLTNSSIPDPAQFDNIDVLKDVSQKFLDHTITRLGDKTMHTIIKQGDFAESILLAAKEMHADTIVIGSHSHKWLENIIMGSVAEKVLRLTSIPLFIVPTKKRD